MADSDAEKPSPDQDGEQAFDPEVLIQGFVERGLDPVTAREGVKWAIRWAEEYAGECQELFGEVLFAPAHKVRDPLMRASAKSFSPAPKDIRYPVGTPTIKAMMVAKETFALAQSPEDREAAEGLMRVITYGY